jgi:adenosylcobinamide kinase / adenosylcobinamide-phosphate guanylyltransferase
VLVLIGGGSRSGKSRFALEYARRCGEPRTYIATAETLDDEMLARARAHQAERGCDFHTVEEPLDVARAVAETAARAVVVDCLTLWLSNLMNASRDLEKETTRLLRAAMDSAATVLLVANEVGCGIVPESELSRRFRDEAGRMNQRAAAAADEVYWMAFGLALRMK